MKRKKSKKFPLAVNMAAASLEKKSKSPKGAQIVSLPVLGDTQFVLCAGTHVPVGPEAIMCDNAQNAFAVASPFVGYLLLRNLSDRKNFDTELCQQNSVERLYPGLGSRQLSMMMNSLTRKDYEKNFDVEKLEDEAAKMGKDKKKAITKFVEALEEAINRAPFRWTRGGERPGLPLSQELEAGETWDSLVDNLRDLFNEAEEFESRWGWHCEGLKKSCKDIAQKRRDRRAKKDSMEVSDDQ